MKLGDLIFYITKYTGIKYLVDRYHDYKGTKCKCDDRRKKLNKIKISRKWYNSMKKIIKNGEYFAGQNESRSQEKNLKWFASCTHSIKSTIILNPALVHPKK